MREFSYVTDFDLHIHGKHSGGVSPKMEIPVIAEEAEKIVCWTRRRDENECRP